VNRRWLIVREINGQECETWYTALRMNSAQEVALWTDIKQRLAAERPSVILKLFKAFEPASDKNAMAVALGFHCPQYLPIAGMPLLDFTFQADQTVPVGTREDADGYSDEDEDILGQDAKERARCAKLRSLHAKALFAAAKQKDEELVKCGDFMKAAEELIAEQMRRDSGIVRYTHRVVAYESPNEAHLTKLLKEPNMLQEFYKRSFFEDCCEPLKKPKKEKKKKQAENQKKRPAAATVSASASASSLASAQPAKKRKVVDVSKDDGKEEKWCVGKVRTLAELQAGAKDDVFYVGPGEALLTMRIRKSHHAEDTAASDALLTQQFAEIAKFIAAGGRVEVRGEGASLINIVSK
jgi:hypothetical protein